MGTQSWHAGRKGSSWQEKSLKSTIRMTRFGTFLLIAALSSFITAAPQKRLVRAAMDYEAICNSAAAAYSNAKAEGKPTKRAAALSAKIFFENVFDSYVDSGFPAGGLRRCANAVDAAQAQSERDGGVLQRRRQGRHRGAHPCVQGRHPRLPQGQDCRQEVQQGEDRGVRRVSQGF